MKKYKIITAAFLFLVFTVIHVNAQNLDFELRFNDATSIYEVYVIPDSTNALYFVGGGSQLSLILPQDIADVPLNITTVNGGLWTDNSRIFAPESDHIHDFHGVASNGSIVSLEKDEPLLLFTFELPDGSCRSDIRLYENSLDLDSEAFGMDGGDFRNFFANVFRPYENCWKKNKNEVNATCAHAPSVTPENLTLQHDTPGVICMSIVDPNIDDSFQVQLCPGLNPSENGVAVVSVTGNEICLEYSPSVGYAGIEEVCLEVCDQTGLCNTAIVLVEVASEVIHATISASNNQCENVVEWTVFNPSNFTYFDLERSDDGITFEPIKQFESNNQTNNQVLNFIDDKISNGHYYRLRLAYENGDSEYSTSIFVESDCEVSPPASLHITAQANHCINQIDWAISNPSRYTSCELQRGLDENNYKMLYEFETRNQLSPQAFHFIDDETQGNHYYRLKLIDIDGNEVLSDPFFVESDCIGDFIIFPNPISQSNPILNVRFKAETKSVDVIISDVLGRVLKRTKLKVEIGMNHIHFDISNFAVGNYFLMIEGKEKKVKSFTKMDERF